ncbi:hypothetical protein Q9189_006542, partial [Teloschistes chrysophthalmus]
MSQADEHLQTPVAQACVMQSAQPLPSSDLSSLIPSYQSSSRDVTPELEATPVHQYSSPSTSYCASPSSQSAELGQEHPSTKALDGLGADKTSMARSQDGADCDSECEDGHAGGVSLIEQQDDLVSDQQIDSLVELTETPERSPSALEVLQQLQQNQDEFLPGPDLDLFLEHHDPFESSDTSTSPNDDPHNVTNELLPLHAHGNDVNLDASVHSNHGQSSPPDMIPNAEGQHTTELNGPPDPVISNELDSDDDDGWEPSFSIFTGGAYSTIGGAYSTTGGTYQASFGQLEVIVNDPYPQLYPWPFAGSVEEAYQHHHEIGFFGASDERRNMTFLECLRFWRDGYAIQQKDRHHSLRDRNHFVRLTDHDILVGMEGRWRHTVNASDLKSRTYDFQGIDWALMGVKRRQARIVRRNTYFNHANVITSYPQAQVFNRWPMFASSSCLNNRARSKAAHIRNRENFFQFSQMMRHRIFIPHFQLRHIVSASSKNAVFFPTVVRDDDGSQTTGSQISCVNPEIEFDNDLIIDSAQTDPDSEAPNMQKIYTLSASHDILVAGGLGGEYAFRSLSSPPTTHFTSGIITFSHLSSTNHVHTYLDRRSGLPRIVFSSNDNNIHTLDPTTNKFISRHDHLKPVNCAATSPDTRLRILVRDAKHSLLVEADTGKRIGKLGGHSDFAFACDWADDGYHVATGAQDGLVQIYDMRNWRTPLKTLLTELGGVRSLAFSPAAGGRPVLVMAESADFVHVVDAVTFERDQTFDFFGEVAGVGFEPEGRRFYVGVGDPDVGGLMEFER